MNLSFLHKKPIFGVGGILIVISIILLFATCDIGLGPIVNTKSPIIKNSGDNLPGAFLHGNENKISLDVSNELGFKIGEVFVEIEYFDLETQTTKTKKVYAQQDSKGEWFVMLDVSDMGDGKIRTWVTAIDESGNKTTSTEIPYTVKNMLPQIKLNIPAVSEDDFDNDNLLNNLVTTDMVYQGLDLMGIATDAYQIADGFPKIMFWSSEHLDFPVDEDMIPTDNKYGQWRTVELPLNYKSGSEVVRFTWPLCELIRDDTKPETDPDHWRLPRREPNGKYGNEFSPLPANKNYRFRIWVRDGFGNDNFYPNRIDNKRGLGGTAVDPNTVDKKNKSIEIYHMAIGDQAIVQVPDMKQFYNRADAFKINLVVLTGTGMDPTNGNAVEAWVHENYDTTLGEKWGPYYARMTGNTNPYEYELIISKTDAQKWGNREGRYYLALQATDSGGKPGPLERKPFDLDLTPPEAKFDQPGPLDNQFKTGDIVGGKYTILYPPQNSRPKWVTATVTAGGKSTDSFGVEKVYYHIGKSGDDKLSDSELVTFFNNNDSNDDDTNPIPTNPFWRNTKVGTANPAPNWGGSVYAWTYTQPYPKGYKTSHADLVQELSDLDFIPDPSVSANYATQGKERFYLPIYVKVVDVAGNKQIVHYKLSIDPDLDDPSINFVYPKAGNIVGGTVRMNGTAEDNIWMHTVLMRIHKDGDGSTPANNDYWYRPTTVPETKFFYEENPSGYPTPDCSNAQKGWFKLTSITGDGAVVNWTSTVNGDGKLNPPTGVDTVDVTIDCVAIDTTVSSGPPRAAGPVETQIVKFSSKVPLIENIQLIKNKGTSIENIRDYNEGISTSGKFVMSMKISAVSGIFKLLAKINDNPQVTLITNNSVQITSNAVWQVTTPTQVGGGENRYESILTVTIDSTNTSSLGGIGYGITNIMNLEVTVEDNTESKFTTTRNLKVGIDNFYPSGTIETSTMAYDNISANKFFLVQGTAKDWGTGSGVLQGLERVLVYFEKAKITYSTPGTFTSTRKVEGSQTMIDPSGGVIPSGTSGYFVEYPDVMDTTKTLLSNPAEPNVKNGFSGPKLIYDEIKKIYTSPSAMVIDYAENDPLQDYDDDGTYGEKWIGLTDKTWEARMMISDRLTGSQKFKDGPYIVHYLIMDTAGNTTHYQKDIYVENNKPIITGINIGTDINFNNTVTYPDEYRTQAYIVNNNSENKGFIETPNSEFRIRNKLFGVSITWGKGNDGKTAKITYVTQGSKIPVTSMKRGRVYQIANTAPTTDFTKYGSPNGYKDTVFVASCAGEGEAEVYEFNDGNSQSSSLGQATEATTTANIFSSFTGITDTETGLFVVKVYDTTVSTTSNGGTAVDPEFDQLAQAVLLSVSVNNTDNIDPQIEVGNFGTRHKTKINGNASKWEDNELTNVVDAVYSDYVDTTTTGIKNGYVQYQAHSTPNTTANISGKVIFNGKVNDNHRIEQITVQIRNGNNSSNYNNGNELVIANRDSNNGLLKAANNNAEREFRLVYNEADVPQYSLAHGHTLVWQFMWDSSKLSTVAQNNVSVTFKVYDQTRTNTSIQTVNVVPYIAEVVTPLSGANKSAPSAFNRSALGGYPVREGDPITIKGFNFGTATTNIVTLNGDTIGTVTNNGTTITGNIPTTNATVSGPLAVTVSGVPSFNNSTSKNKTVAYNKEPNNVNNNILDNARYMYVWTAGYMLNKSTADITSPFFRMDPATGVRYISYGYYGPNDGNTTQSSLRMLINNGDGRAWDDATSTPTANNNNPRAFGRQLATTQNRYISITNAIGTNGEFYVISSNQTQGGSPFNLYTSNALGSAQPTIYTFQLDATSNPGRFEIPRIWAKNSSTTATAAGDARRVIASYYDNDNSNLYFRYGSRSSSTATTATAGNNANWTGFTAASVTTAASKYSAVGALSNGRPVIAYYNGSSLTFAYGTTAPSASTHGNANPWGNNNIVASPTWTSTTITNTDSRGAHVDLAVDAGDNVHIAFYDVANGGLYYLLVPAGATAGTLNTTSLTPVQVDTYLAVGTKLMINVRTDAAGKYVPYITYFHGSFSETRNSIRVAWRKEFTANADYNGTNETDMFTGKWEVMTVPAINTPVASEMVCNGVPTVSGAQTTGARWVEVNTHGTGAGSPLSRKGADLSKSIVIGYMTNANYEGAILKGDMTTTPAELQK